MYITNETAIKIINVDLDLYDIISGCACDISDRDSTIIMEMYDRIARDFRYNPDDDFESILDAIYNEIYQDYGHLVKKTA